MFSKNTQPTKAPIPAISMTPHISLNLLPKSHFENQKKLSLIYLINKISIGLLAVLVLLTAATLIMRLLQRFELQKSNEVVKEAEARVNSFQSKEASLELLKTRIDEINKLTGVDAKRKAIFNLVVFLSPNDITFNDINVGRDGSAVVAAASPSLFSIDQLINNLGNKEKNAGVISKVILDGLNLGKDGQYRISLKVYPK